MSKRTLKVGDRIEFRDGYKLLGFDKDALFEGEIVALNGRGGAVVKLGGAKFSPPLIYVALRYVTRVHPALAPKQVPLTDAIAGLHRMLGSR